MVHSFSIPAAAMGSVAVILPQKFRAAAKQGEAAVRSPSWRMLAIGQLRTHSKRAVGGVVFGDGDLRARGQANVRKGL